MESFPKNHIMIISRGIFVNSIKNRDLSCIRKNSALIIYQAPVVKDRTRLVRRYQINWVIYCLARSEYLIQKLIQNLINDRNEIRYFCGLVELIKKNLNLWN